jgi:Uma2 family endonuclease
MTLSTYSHLKSATRSSDQSLPTMDNLPSDDPLEPGLPDEFHGLQPQLLAETLHLEGYDADNQFNAFDLNLYYDPEHLLWYKRPDWFLVVGVSRMYRGERSRSSYVIWDEQVPPAVVVEFLSPSTEADDLGPFSSKTAAKRKATEGAQPPSKFVVYEQILKVPHYIIFDEATLVLRHFRLLNGAYQEETVSDASPQIWIASLGIGLGIWQGRYRGLDQHWLRWCGEAGNWLLTEAETERFAKEAARAAREIERMAKEAERAEKEAERSAKEMERAAKEMERAAKEMERAEKEAAQAEQQRLADYLRSIGLDPDNLPPGDTNPSG